MRIRIRQTQESAEELAALHAFGPECLKPVLIDFNYWAYPLRIGAAEIPFYMRGFQVESVTASSDRGYARQIMVLKRESFDDDARAFRRYIVTEVSARAGAAGVPTTEIKVGYFNRMVTAGADGGDVESVTT